MSRLFKAQVSMNFAGAGPQVVNPDAPVDARKNRVKILFIRATRTAAAGTAYSNFDVEIYDAATRAAGETRYTNPGNIPDSAGLIVVDSPPVGINYEDEDGAAQVHLRVRANGGDGTSTATVLVDVEGEVLL